MLMADQRKVWPVSDAKAESFDEVAELYDQIRPQASPGCAGGEQTLDTAPRPDRILMVGDRRFLKCWPP